MASVTRSAPPREADRACPRSAEIGDDRSETLAPARFVPPVRAPAPTARPDAPTAPPRFPRNPRLAELAEQVRNLQRRWRGPSRERCSSGLPALDAALGGGFLLGATHELLAGADAAPAHSLALLAAARALRRSNHKAEWMGRVLVYVDARDDLYPPAVARLGIPLDRLIVVRAQRTRDVLWVCEQALRCRVVAATIAAIRRLDRTVSRRLQLAAEAGGGLGLLLRPRVPLLCEQCFPDRAAPLPHGLPLSAAKGRGSEPTFAATRLQVDPHPPQDGRPCARITIRKLRCGSGFQPVALLEPFVAILPDADYPTGNAPQREDAFSGFGSESLDHRAIPG